MADKMVFVVTCSDESPDKATIPFALGNAALAMDAEVIIVLQSNGVFLGKKDFARHINAPGFPPLAELMEIFQEAGGALYICEPCIKGRKIAAQDLIDGAEIVAGATLVDRFLDATSVAVY